MLVTFAISHIGLSELLRDKWHGLFNESGTVVTVVSQRKVASIQQKNSHHGDWFGIVIQCYTCPGKSKEDSGKLQSFPGKSFAIPAQTCYTDWSWLEGFSTSISSTVSTGSPPWFQVIPTATPGSRRPVVAFLSPEWSWSLRRSCMNEAYLGARMEGLVWKWGNIWEYMGNIYIYIIINLIIYIYMDLLMFREKTIVNQLFLGTLPTQKPWHKDWWSPK